MVRKDGKKNRETYQDTVTREQVSSIAVETAAVLELGLLVQLLDHLHSDAVLLLEECQVLLLVAAQAAQHGLVAEKLHELAGGLLELGQALLLLVLLLEVLVGDVVEVVDVLGELADVAGHVGGLEELEQHLLLVDGLLLVLSGRREVEQRVEQVAVEVRHHLRQEAVLVGDGLAAGLCGRHAGLFFAGEGVAGVAVRRGARIWGVREGWWLRAEIRRGGGVELQCLLEFGKNDCA